MARISRVLLDSDPGSLASAASCDLALDDKSGAVTGWLRQIGQDDKGSITGSLQFWLIALELTTVALRVGADFVAALVDARPASTTINTVASAGSATKNVSNMPSSIRSSTRTTRLVRRRANGESS
jgi:hypothetical protein